MVILSFLTIPWLGPKDREPCVPSVQKAKLGHRTMCTVGPKGKAKIHRALAPSVPKVKLRYLGPLWTAI